MASNRAGNQRVGGHTKRSPEQRRMPYARAMRRLRSPRLAELGLLMLVQACDSTVADGDVIDASVARDASYPEGGQGDAAPELPANWSCESAKGQATSDWLAATDGAKRSCSRHEDCQVLQLRVSCSSECPPVSVSAAGKAELEGVAADIEQEHCGTYTSRACSPVPEGLCESYGHPSEPRCYEGQCTWVDTGCSPGCTAQGAGPCRGEPACDGCPSITSEVLGLSCSEPQKTCTSPGGFCPLTVQCSDEKEPGTFRWLRIFDGCE
jgi:hypothetical protein